MPATRRSAVRIHPLPVVFNFKMLHLLRVSCATFNWWAETGVICYRSYLNPKLRVEYPEGPSIFMSESKSLVNK